MATLYTYTITIGQLTIRVFSEPRFLTKFYKAEDQNLKSFLVLSIIVISVDLFSVKTDIYTEGGDNVVVKLLNCLTEQILIQPRL